MCRWFAYISPAEPCLLSDVLITPAHAITKQVSDHYLPGLLPHGHEHDLPNSKDDLLRLRNVLLNFDGLGITWYTSAASAYTSQQSGPRPSLYKSASPPTSDFNFRTICENTEAYCLFAHIRAASATAVTQVNSHPFVFGRHTFMHNGVISDFTRVRRDLSHLISYAAFDHIQGSSDTEHAAALYVTYLCGAEATSADWQRVYPLSAMRAAMEKTVVSIMEMQREVLGDKARANSLNFCATDGQKMLACRFRNHETEQPSSLYWSEFAGRTLNRKFPGNPDGQSLVNEEVVVEHGVKHGKHTIIASEPTTFDESEWNLMRRNCMLLVDEMGTETEIELKYDSALNGTS